MTSKASGTCVISTSETTIDIANVIVDGNFDVINTGGEEVVNDGEGRTNEENIFYSKVEEYRAGLKYPEKAMLSLVYYQKIIHALKQPKGGKNSGVDSKFHG